jgi:transposase
MGLTLFLLSHSRGRKIAKELIGTYQDKVIISDRYSSYNYISDRNRQVCWAHLRGSRNLPQKSPFEFSCRYI